ncbi:MAG TPA: Hsp20/alpha crystallin family protein [Bacillales bacterium]|nr:Hsp20/alpha crystallin family protein [Bacillales bacterium]
MDVDKLKRWLDAAQQFQGNDFWSDIFDQFPQGQMQGAPHSRNHGDQTNQAPELPLVDILERKRDWVVLIDLAGVDKEDVQLTIAGNQLNIKGVVRTHFRDANLVQSERMSGSFDRTVYLPEPVHENQTTAGFHNGLLEVRIPKSNPPEQQIKID